MHQKIINELDINSDNQPLKLRLKNWVKVDDDMIGKYKINT